MDEASSHALVNQTDRSRVRVLARDEKWSVQDVTDILRDG
jgi:hypothetical protein